MFLKMINLKKFYLKKSQKKAQKLADTGIKILKSLPYDTKKLEDLCKLIVERQS